VHRRALPIANPCDVFRPGAGRTFCDKCEKHVHDLSAMTEREAKRFLSAHEGREICVAYRSRRDGTVVHRPERRPIGLALAALGVAACTGHAPDIEHPGESCRDPQGYEIDCVPAVRPDVVVPDDPTFEPVEPVVTADEPPIEPVVAQPPIEPELTAGTMVYIPERAAQSKREARREARRERRADRDG
jgi:hypothetical protein